MKIFIALIISFQYFLMYPIYSNDKVLCVEIGHSRVKACMLPVNPTLEELRLIETIENVSSPWLGQNIKHLFLNDKSPLYPILITKPTTLSLSIFGTEKYSKYPSGKVDDYPDNLEELLSYSFGDSFHIERDTNAWAIGALEYLALHKKTPEYPCLAVTLGTGVGLVLIENKNTIRTIEFWTMPWKFPKLEPLSVNFVKEPVLILGKNYLAEFFHGENNIDEGMKEYKGKYNKHFWTFVEDVNTHIEEMFGYKISSVLVGGGNSRFIKASKTPLPLYLLNPQLLKKDGISPDIIQLLGCIKKIKDKNTQTYIVSENS